MTTAESGESDHPAPDFLGKLRQAIVQRATEIAVRAPDATLTYAELDRLSNQLAHWLVVLSGERALRIGISVPHGAIEIIAILATLKAGSTYVPLEWSCRPEWLRRVVDVVTPRLLIVDQRSPLAAVERGSGEFPIRLVVDDIRRLTESQDPLPPSLHFAPAPLACVAFGPESAGPPRGVEISRYDVDGLRIFLPLWMGRPIVIEDPSAASDSQRPTAFAVEGMPRRNSLVTLQEGDDELAPLFLVHDADGEVFVYNNLAWRMGNRRSVYAFRPCGRSDAPLLQTRIEDMAATYVREIRQVRPHGPYLLGGLCAGGVLAFEMALQLEAANEEARLIALLDTTDVEARAKPLRQASRRIRRFRKAVGAASVRQLPEAVATKVFGYLNYEAHAWLHRAYDAFAVATFTFCENRRLPLPPWARGLPVRTLFAGAESRYRPGNRVREEIVLFRATEGDGSLEPFVAAYADPLFGWGRRSAKGARAIDVPTSHAAMLEEPNVGFIAEALRSYLGDDESVRRG